MLGFALAIHIEFPDGEQSVFAGAESGRHDREVPVKHVPQCFLGRSELRPRQFPQQILIERHEVSGSRHAAQVFDIAVVVRPEMDFDHARRRLEQHLRRTQPHRQGLALPHREGARVPVGQITQRRNQPRVVVAVEFLLDIEKIILIDINLGPVSHRDVTVDHLSHERRLFDGMQAGIDALDVNRPFVGFDRAEMVALLLLQRTQRVQLLHQAVVPGAGHDFRIGDGFVELLNVLHPLLEFGIEFRTLGNSRWRQLEVYFPGDRHGRLEIQHRVPDRGFLLRGIGNFLAGFLGLGCCRAQQ